MAAAIIYLFWREAPDFTCANETSCELPPATANYDQLVYIIQ